MNKTIAKTVVMAVALTATLALGACKVEKTEDGKLPTVDVKADAGKLPEYNVQTAKVNVGTEKKTIEVPTVSVDMPSDKDTKTTDQADSTKH